MEVNPVFKVGQSVWHKAGEKPKGIVIDWSYQRRLNSITYQVAFYPTGESKWYYQEELSETQIF